MPVLDQLLTNDYGLIVAGLLLLYAVEPLNLAIPLVGLVDDLVLVPLVLHTLLKRLPAEIHASVGRRRTL